MALLVAIVASMTALVNFVNSQTSAVGQLANVGGKYLVVSSGNSVSLSDSRLSPETVNSLNVSVVKSCFPQKIVNASMQTVLGVFAVSVVGVKDVDAYLKAQGASLNGSVVKGQSEATLGVLLAQTCNVTAKDAVNITVGDVKLTLKVAGTVRTLTQLDSVLIVPIETANILSGNSDLSFIEFTLKTDVNRPEALNSISAALPLDVKVVKVQQTSQFMKESVGETLDFLAVWSITVYLVVAASSYVVSARLIVDLEYELGMLRAIGAKRRRLFFWVFDCSVLVAFVGSVLGIALGLAGTQVAAAGLRWFWQSIQVNTFLEPLQIGQILVFSLAFSAVGCIYPCFKGMKRSL